MIGGEKVKSVVEARGAARGESALAAGVLLDGLGMGENFHGLRSQRRPW